MNQSSYTDEKPKDCRYCYFWDPYRKRCHLRKDNCYYRTVPEGENPKGPCDGCAYAVPYPCIGFCMRRVLGRDNAVEEARKEELALCE